MLIKLKLCADDGIGSEAPGEGGNQDLGRGRHNNQLGAPLTPASPSLHRVRAQEILGLRLGEGLGFLLKNLAAHATEEFTNGRRFYLSPIAMADVTDRGGDHPHHTGVEACGINPPLEEGHEAIADRQSSVKVKGDDPGVLDLIVEKLLRRAAPGPKALSSHSVYCPPTHALRST